MLPVVGKTVLSAVDFYNKLESVDVEIGMIIPELLLPFNNKRQPPEKIVIQVFFFRRHFATQLLRNSASAFVV